MYITSIQQTGHHLDTPEPGYEKKSITHRLDAYLGRNEMGIQRLMRVRNAVLAKPADMHRMDNILSNPEQFKNRGLRALIHLGKHVEELADGCADISGLAERLTRNIISSGDKADLPQVIASAVGRIIAGQLNLTGMAVHKVAGSALYALSSLISIAAIGIASSKYIGKRSPEEIARAQAKSHFEHTAFTFIGEALHKAKHAALNKLIEKANNSNSRHMATIRNWAMYLSSKRASVPEHMASLRKNNCNYMWNNLHQYGRVTRVLMHIGYGTFLGVNKLLVSYDKHAGNALGEHVFRKYIGNVLGCRLGLMLTVGVAAAISFPMSPFIVGISTAGAAACGLAFIALLLAKGNVYFFSDWKGNIPRPQPQIRSLVR